MRYMTTGDLSLVLNDMFKTKLDLLNKTISFKIYESALAGNRDKLNSIVEILKRKPLTEELKEADDLHDSTGRAVYYICKGMSSLPILAEEKRDLLSTVSERLVPALSDFTRNYEDEASSAKKKRDLVAGMKAELSAFPVAPDMTLYDLLDAHVGAGEKIDTLLAKRADTTAKEDAAKLKEASSIRPATIGLINRLREAMEDEVSMNDELDDSLANKIFAYYDQIAQTREDRSAKPKTPPVTA